MKILSLHTDYIKWQAQKKALKSIEDLSEEELKEHEVKEALVILTAIEKNDTNIPEAIEKYTQEIKKIAEQIGAKNIVLYPYAHLSNNLGKPTNAREIVIKGHEEEDITEEERKRLLKEISKSKLDTSKLKDNDHRIIGRKLDLWSFNETAPGMVFWHHKGLHLKNKLIELWREIHRKDYTEISTPQILDRKLWEISGHWTKYSENNFKTIYENRDFLVKPMNCPGGMLVYKTSPKSYKDLPMRVGELGIVHRVELSGTLSGLFRVIQFTQDDAHIFCTEKQLENGNAQQFSLTWHYRKDLSWNTPTKKEKSKDQ